MTGSIDVLVNVFDNLESEHYSQIIDNLNIDEIKLLNTQVLTQIKSMNQLSQLRKLLSQRVSELSKNQPKKNKTHPLILINSTLEDQLMALADKIVQLHAKSEVVDLVEPVSKSWLTTVIEFFVQSWVSFINFFSKLFKSPTSATPQNANKTADTYKVTLEEEDNELFEAMRKEGAQYTSDVLGRTGLGDELFRSPQSRKEAILGRYGIVLSSQVVAGTNSATHDSLSTVAESLVLQEDDNQKIAHLFRALTNGQNNSLKDQHVFSSPGNDLLVSAMETQDLKNILANENPEAEYGFTFSAKERALIETYKKNNDRSKILNHAIGCFAFSWGGYEETILDNGKKGYKKRDEGFEAKQNEFETKLKALSKTVLKNCAELEDGEALFIDTGLEGHAMKIAIQCLGNEFKLTCYDSSGALENSENSKHLIGLLKLQFMGYEAKRSNALSFIIPRERLISETGLDYFNKLIRQHSYVGWAETSIEGHLSHTTMEERSRMGFINTIRAHRNQSKIYLAYLDKFKAIALPSSPPQFDSLLQHTQNTENCFAKRVQSCQLYELGKPTYKKLRMALLIEQKKGLLNDIFGNKTNSEEKPFLGTEYLHMLHNVSSEFLSPDELYTLSLKLSEISDVPSTEYYESFFQDLLNTRAALVMQEKSSNQLAIERIDLKMASHAKSYYFYLLKGKRFDDIKQVFSTQIFDHGATLDWNSLRFDINSADFPLNKDNNLQALSEYAAAQTWKASIQLINHQIQKLGVNERFIHSPEERLTYASHGQIAKKITLNDLEQANIVQFTIGFAREEKIKIELNCNGQRQEVDKETFFKLVVANKKALTSPQVIHLLDYLRNCSPAIAKRFDLQVYPAQFEAMEIDLSETIAATTNQLIHAIDKLGQYDSATEQLMSSIERQLESLELELALEKNESGEEKNSLGFTNLETRKSLLVKELAQLASLKQSIITKKALLSESPNVSGSSNHQIAEALELLNQLHSSDPEFQTVRAVTNTFVSAQSKLKALTENLTDLMVKIEIDEIENRVSERTKNINEYRHQLISQSLQANPEFRVLDELASGLMGTEKDRNRTLYASLKSQNVEEKSSGYLPGSVFAKIQDASKSLRKKTFDIVDHELILETCTENALMAQGMQSLVSSKEDYIHMEEQAKTISKGHLPNEMKELWIKELFQIWMQHVEPKVLLSLSQKEEALRAAAINNAFIHFLEHKANLKYATFKDAFYPNPYTYDELKAIGWKETTEAKLQALQEQKGKAAVKIMHFLKEKKAKVGLYTAQVEAKNQQATMSLKPEDLRTQQQAFSEYKPYEGFRMPFLSHAELEKLGSSTLKFLRDHKIPQTKGDSESSCLLYYGQVLVYLNQLKGHPSLENKRERVLAFCLAVSDTLLNLNTPPSKLLVNELAKSILNEYRDEEGQITNVISSLENSQRQQLLKSLLRLTLSQLRGSKGQIVSVNSECYSIIKHWEKFLVPADKQISDCITMLSPKEIPFKHEGWIKELDRAILASPIGIEGIIEGQKGLQCALTNYGKESGVNSNLRMLADRLGMRNGDGLLVHQFLNYYSDSKVLFSNEGINSTQGREFFSRAYLDAYQHADSAERNALLQFLHELKLDIAADALSLKTPHKVFKNELLMQCALLDSNLVIPDHSSINAFTEGLTSASNHNAEDRLFGFAKKINLLALKIQKAELEGDEEHFDLFYSRFICANLAYQSILDQASEDVLANLNENFEYQREMNRVESNRISLHNALLDFSSHMESNHRAAVFTSVFQQYNDALKFDGPKLTIQSPSSLDIPGFIKLAGNKSLDVVHGVVYLGNNKLGFMPTSIQSHVTLQRLEMSLLPYRLEGSSWVYIEDSAVKALITPLANGELIVQRQLRTLDGADSMLQYLPFDQIRSLPIAIKNQMNAAHFFIDSEGAMHGYSKDFKPLLKLSLQNEDWVGSLIDHQGSKISIRLDKKASALSKKLAQLFPYEEMISLDEDRVYIPSLKQYVIFERSSDSYFISNGIHEHASKRVLKWTEEGSGYTELVLSPTKANEVALLQVKIQDLQQKIEAIKAKDLLSLQQKSTLKEDIKTCKNQILKMTEPLHFVFVAKDHELLSYSMDHDNRLIPQEFQSILQVGRLAGKTDLFVEFLAKVSLKSPLSSNDFENLITSLKEYQSKGSLDSLDLSAISLLMGIEIQHHLLERELSLRGKKQGWDKERFEYLLKAFSQQVKDLHGKDSSVALTCFSELWQEIQAEFALDSELQNLLTKITPTAPYQQKPININSKTTAMPIELLSGRSLIQFTPHQEIDSLIDEEQKQLKARLHEIEEQSDSIKKQEEGYYYEHYGLFNQETLFTLFRVSAKTAGINGLSQKDVSNLFNWMLENGWIKPLGQIEQCQLTRHPAEFYSNQKLAAYLAHIGLDRKSIKAVANRLEHFLYETAVSGGAYSIQPGQHMELVENLVSMKKRLNLEVLEANETIESLLAKASTDISRTELNSAFLLNDYSRFASLFPENERTQIEIALNNALTRLMYYKTELDHLNDVQDTLDQGKEAKALAMLHIRRNYNLDTLLSTQAIVTEDAALTLEQDRKMQRAFLMFEYQFGHRCNARQVDVFRGLLLDDELDPEKIDSAQARMGFGKTTLLPLVALYKTGTHLVRFIVPKSALETNTSDMSTALTHLLGTRAIKDDFQRYKIEVDPEANMGDASPRLKSLQDQKADLKKRLSLYERVKRNHEVLTQAPHVRNSLECQTKIYLDLLLKLDDEPEIKKELLDCITLINQIRSLTTVSVFDELDATQNSSTTDVNYPTGDKSPLDSKEIYPLELITQTISTAKHKTPDALARLLLKKFKIADSDEAIFTYITSVNISQPLSIIPEQATEIYLMRAVLTDPVFLSLLTEKEPSTDFGVWFEHLSDGTKGYDYRSNQTVSDSESKNPLLIAIPYSAANTPKPQGTRFDNPEVTAVATFLYYLDKRTLIEEVPHLEYLIQSFKKGTGEEALFDSLGNLPEEFTPVVKAIKELAQIEDTVSRNAARKGYFEKQLMLQARNTEVFRRILARTIIKEQIQFDSGKANSKRYEQGTVHDQVIGFSGTVGDTSSHFKINKLDPAADGNLTLGIMGRSNCQKTITLDTRSLISAEEDFTQALIAQLALSFTETTRVLIDAGGLSKAFNRDVAKAIAIQLKQQNRPINGVIFYDDVSNTKKLLVLNSDNEDSVVDLTEEMVKESDLKGSFFTYYDQAHSRGADIKQMDGAQAIVTLNFNVTNNDYKQAIMRMRKIVDKNSGQSFIPALPQALKEQISVDLNLEAEAELTGNDIAYWLREKELKDNSNAVSLLTTELDAIVKNAILQQQAQITDLMAKSGLELDEDKIAVFTTCVTELNTISPFISGSLSQLEEKYGKILGKIKKEVFVADLKQRFETQLTAVFVAVEQARKQLGLVALSSENKKPYYDMKERILQKREPELSEEFELPSPNQALAEVVSDVEVQSQSHSQSQAQVQAQTHSFSQVAEEAILAGPNLTKATLPFEPVSITFLDNQDALAALPLASQIESLQHLFLDADGIFCSPSYQLRKEANEPCPPVRYVLAREEGNPKILLINQDEADLVKLSGKTAWSLYDLSQKQDTWVPLVGEAIASLSDSLMKKLQFSAYQFEIKGNSLETMAQSLSGICTLAQLKPSLAIQNEEKHGSIEQLFQLPEWGFSGTKVQDIPLHLEQSQEVFNNQFEKTGVTIHLGQGDHAAKVFISSTLDKRILSTLDHIKQDTSPTTSLVKQLVSDVDLEYGATKTKITHKIEDIHSLKDQKRRISDEMDAKLLVLNESRREALQIAQNKISASFKANMKQFLEARAPLSRLLINTLNYLSESELIANGITVGTHKFPSIIGAINTLLMEALKQPQDLEASLNKIITQISEAAHKMYQEQTQYTYKQGTFIEAMKASLPKAQRQNGKWKLITLGDVRFWYQSFNDVFTEHFIQFYGNEEIWSGLKDCFKKAVEKDHRTGGDFEESLITRVRHFSKKIAPESFDQFNFEFMMLLSYTLNTGDPQKFKQAVQEDIEQVILKYMKNKISNPSLEQESLFLEVNRILDTKIRHYDYKLPDLLLDYKQEPKPAKIQAAVKIALDRQNIKASDQQVNALADDCIGFIKNQKAVQQLFEHYSPVHNRSTLLKDGIELYSEAHEALVQADEEVLAFDQEIAETKGLKKSQLAKLDEQQKSLNAELQVYKAEFKELKAEKKACNKLRSGLSQLGSVFSEQQVTIAEQDPDLILDRYFGMEALIKDKASGTATLSFRPPEFYSIESDMHEQQVHMQGLNDRETPALEALDKTVRTVHHCAALVQSREYSVDGLMQNNQAKPGLSILGNNRSSLWASKQRRPDIETKEEGFQLEK